MSESAVAVENNINQEQLSSFDHSVDNQTIRTHEASSIAPIAVEQYSHLFPAHLYVKKRTAGQEFDHNEDVGGALVDNEVSLEQNPEPAPLGLPLLFDHESKV